MTSMTSEAVPSDIAFAFIGEAPAGDRFHSALETLAARSTTVLRLPDPVMAEATTPRIASAAAQAIRAHDKASDVHPHWVIVGAGVHGRTALMAAMRLHDRRPHVALTGDLARATAGERRRAERWLTGRGTLSSDVRWGPDVVNDPEMDRLLEALAPLRGEVADLGQEPFGAAVTRWLATRPALLGGYALDPNDLQRSRWAAAPGETVAWALGAQSGSNQQLAVAAVDGREVARVDLTIGAAPQAPAEPWHDSPGYPVAGTWRVPASLDSGVYLLDGRPELFTVVREPSRPAPVAFLLSTNTFNAYSVTQERSLYNHPRRAAAVTFRRPMDRVKANEWLPMLKWAATQPELVGQHKVLIDADLDEDRVLDGVEVLVVVGHSEYWTRAAREVFDRFVQRGGRALVAGGNTFWWQVRYDTDGDLLVCNKEVRPGVDAHDQTINWAAPSLDYPITRSTGGDFARGGFGRERRPDSLSRSGFTVVAPTSPLLAGLSLQRGDFIDLWKVREFDGMPVAGLDHDGFPVPDYATLGTTEAEIVAYAWGRRGDQHTMGTLHVFRPPGAAGVVVHLGAKEAAGMGRKGDEATVSQIIETSIHILRNGLDPFSGAAPREIIHPMSTPLATMPDNWPNPAAYNP